MYAGTKCDVILTLSGASQVQQNVSLKNVLQNMEQWFILCSLSQLFFLILGKADDSRTTKLAA